MHRACARHRGFTIVELAVTMLVLAILVRLSAPSMATWIGNQRLRTSAESILHGLSVARSEAMRRNARVLFVMNDVEGRSSWTVCPVAQGGLACDPLLPPVLVREGGEESGAARVGTSADAATVASASAFAAPLAPGEGMPAMVMFDGLGRTVAQAGWTNTVRFDARNLSIPSADERRLVVAVAPAGGARMCDPLVAAGNPAAC